MIATTHQPAYLRHGKHGRPICPIHDKLSGKRDFPLPRRAIEFRSAEFEKPTCPFLDPPEPALENRWLVGPMPLLVLGIDFLNPALQLRYLSPHDRKFRVGWKPLGLAGI